MLKLLQTGDLHLGKIFYEHSLLDDQKYVLDQILQELQTEFDKNDPYEALLITGDVYDRAVASSDAITIFDSFLVSAHTRFPHLAICIISGNHDSAKRMSFATSLLESQNIHICTRAEECTKPILLYKNSDTLQKKSPIAALYQLPFLYAGDFKTAEGIALHSQTDLVTQAVHKITAAHKKLQKSKSELATLPALLNAHLNTITENLHPLLTKTDNSSLDTSNIADGLLIGGAESVHPKIFDFFDYVALGHIHKPMKIAQNIYYAGSPLETSFKNTGINSKAVQKHFLRVQLDLSRPENSLGSLFTEDVVTVTNIDVTPLHPVLRVEDTFSEFENATFSKMEHLEVTFEDLENSYLEITCTDTILVENPLARLQKKYPLTLAINQKALNGSITSQNFTERQKLFKDTNDLDKVDDAAIFDAFIADVFPGTDKNDWKDAQKLFLESLK